MSYHNSESASFQVASLVLYKSKAARVTALGPKIEIELDSKKQLQVRPKDILLLHPGPMHSLGELEHPPEGELETAREILVGESTDLKELAELVYGTYTPASAWAAYNILQDGLHFFGSPEEIQVRTREEYEEELRSRRLRVAEKAAWEEFIERLKTGKLHGDDAEKMKEVEDCAYGKPNRERILKTLHIPPAPQSAHKLLLKLKIWDDTVNPYPQRFNFSPDRNYVTLGDVPPEDRLDLTRLAAYAIDDEGNRDPDDALSWDGERLWVHIADAASLVEPGCEADLAAAEWGANLYLPEGPLTMLPPRATALCGLGLKEISPALSFGISLSSTGEIAEVLIRPSLVKVTRLTYRQAEELLEQDPFREMWEFSRCFREYRRSRGAVFLDFPDVKIRVEDGKVRIHPLPQLNSNNLVLEAMLMAGVGAARYALTHKIPFPFTTQPPPSEETVPADLAAMYAFRRKLKPSQIQSSPGLHGGLGLEYYSRATSPLRRYIDLVAHQQIRAHLLGKPVLDEQTIIQRIGSYNAIYGSVVKLERQANLHWTLVYLLHNPGWQGKGIIVEQREREYTVLIPELGLEAGVRIPGEPSLNSEVLLKVTRVDLPELDVHFQAVR